MSFPWLRRAAIAVIGFTVVLIGLAMVVLPGPALVVIPLGLTILATEFVWARRLLNKARATIAGKESGKGKSKFAWAKKLLKKVKFVASKWSGKKKD